MKLTEPFEKARALLGLGCEASLQAIEAAYQKALAELPPEASEEQKAALSKAYQVLTDPIEFGTARLRSLQPFCPLPSVPTPDQLPADPQAPKTLFRALVASLPAEALLSEIK